GSRVVQPLSDGVQAPASSLSPSAAPSATAPAAPAKAQAVEPPLALPVEPSGPPEPTDQHELADAGNDPDAEWKKLDLQFGPPDAQSADDVDLKQHEDDK